MNVFNESLNDMMDEIFEPLNITSKEIETMQEHYKNSKYSRLHITRARRDKEGILCVNYDDGKWFHYETGQWW